MKPGPSKVLVRYEQLGAATRPPPPAYRMRGMLCCVPFCEAVNPRQKRGEWMCKDHKSLVPKEWWKRLKKFIDGDRPDLGETMWARIRARAIERSAGIG